MTFVPDNDANYQAFLTARKAFSGPASLEFTEYWIKYMCSQATATGTINNALVTTANSLATTSTKAQKHNY